MTVESSDHLRRRGRRGGARQRAYWKTTMFGGNVLENTLAALCLWQFCKKKTRSTWSLAPFHQTMLDWWFLQLINKRLSALSGRYGPVHAMAVRLLGWRKRERENFKIKTGKGPTSRSRLFWCSTTLALLTPREGQAVFSKSTPPSETGD